jgi:oligosaccharide repeat unit polymerase
LLAGYFVALGLLAIFVGLQPGRADVWASLFLLCVCLSLPLALRAAKGSIDLFEPIFLVNLTYFLYLVYAPALDLRAERSQFFGKEVHSTLAVATLYASMGIVALSIGYFSSLGERLARAARQPVEAPRGAVTYGIVVAVLALAAFSLWLTTSRYSWLHLLSLGQSTQLQGMIAEEGGTASGAANYLYSAVNCFIPALMIVFAFGRRGRIVWLACFAAALLVYTGIGFRYRILMHVFAPIIFVYLVRDRRPKLRHIAAVGLAAFLLVGVVGELRMSFRSAQRVEDLSLAGIADAFGRNLNIYQPFLAMVDVIPRDHPHLWGRSHGYLLIQPVPRSIWPEKPPPPIHDILTASFGSDEPARAGAFYPNIGEMYADFGLAGILVGMFIFGVFLKALYAYCMRHRHNRWVAILYAIALPFLLQVVSRGLFVQIVYQGVYFFGPIVIGMWLLRGRRKSTVLPAPVQGR